MINTNVSGNNVFDTNLFYHRKLWNDIDCLADQNFRPNYFNESNQRIRILHHNVRSLLKRFSFFESLNLNESVDILSVNETWLRPEIPDSLVTLPGFSIVRSDRNSTLKSRAGGAAIFVSSKLSFSVLDKPKDRLSDFCDSVWIEINFSHKPTIVSSIYIPPDVKKSDFIECLIEVLNMRELKGKQVVLLGDFNINWNQNTREKISIRLGLDVFNLEQKVTGVTFCSFKGNESLLDHIYASKNLEVEKSGILTCDRTVSDHYATFVILKVSKIIRPRRKLIHFRNFKSIDNIAFFNHAKSLPFLQLCSDTSRSLDERIDLFDSLISNLLNNHAPIMTRRIRHHKNPWMNSSLLRLIRFKNQTYKSIFKSPKNQNIQPSTLDDFRKLKSYTLNQIRKAKKYYYIDKLNDSKSSFYQTCGTLLGKADKKSEIDSLVFNNTLVTDEKEIANTFNTFFTSICSQQKLDVKEACQHMTYKTPLTKFEFTKISTEQVRRKLLSMSPKKRGGVEKIPTFIYQILSNIIALPITILINESFLTKSFPSSLKMALVTPIFKKGDHTNPSNYRPISSLPIMSKIFETFMNDQLSTFLTSHKLLNIRQFGFRKSHSCEQLLLSLLDVWKSKLDSSSPCYISALSLDVRKAFDSVNHQLLLTKLKYLYIAESAQSMLSSYLNNRLQCFKVGNATSGVLNIKSGVPQGSILGPLLFNIAINDLLGKFSNSFAFADDTLIFEISDSLNEAISKSESLVTMVTNWYSVNGFNLNLDKTQFCVFSNRKVETIPNLVSNNVQIKSATSIKLLGVILDQHLSLKTYVESLVLKSNRVLFCLSKIRKFVNPSHLLQAYKSYVRPILEYCSSLLLNTSDYNSNLLELCQNRAIRIILGTNSFFSISTGREILNLSTLGDRRRATFDRFVNNATLGKNTSFFILKLINSCKMHNRVLRSGRRIIKPKYRTKYGKTRFLNQFISFSKA
jgi:hypothetical protein